MSVEAKTGVSVGLGDRASKNANWGADSMDVEESNMAGCDKFASDRSALRSLRTQAR